MLTLLHVVDELPPFCNCYKHKCANFNNSLSELTLSNVYVYIIYIYIQYIFVVIKPALEAGMTQW